MKKKVFFIEKMGVQGSVRKCGDCIDQYRYGLTTATHWRFTANKEGGINRSSRRPVCEAHAK